MANRRTETGRRDGTETAACRDDTETAACRDDTETAACRDDTETAAYRDGTGRPLAHGGVSPAPNLPESKAIWPLVRNKCA